MLTSTFLVSASNSAVSPVALDQHAGDESGRRASTCGGEPCDAVARGLRAFFDERLRGPGRKRPLVRRLPHGDRPFPALAGQRRGEVPAASMAAPMRIGMPTIRCSGRSTPTISGPTARTPPISATFARTVSSGSPFRCRRTMRLIDPVTNAPSAETFVDVWRMVPTVNDVALTGPDSTNPWPRVPNPFGGYQLDARVATLQEQALGALTNHAQIQNPPPQRLLDDLASFQRVLFTNHRVRALSDAIRAGHDAAAGSGSAAQRARAAGQGRVRARLRAVPRRARAVDTHRPRSFDSTTSHAVSASGRYRDARSLRLRGLPAAARSQCADLRDHVDQRDHGPADELRSRPRVADRIRRRAWPARTTGTSSTCPGFAASARPRRTSTTTAPPRSKKWSTTTSSSSSA